MVVMAENHQNNKMDSLVQDHGYKMSSSGTQYTSTVLYILVNKWLFNR